MRLRFFLLWLLLGLAAQGAIPVYKNDTLTFIPIYLARSNFLDSATLTWTVDANGRMTPNVIGGASSNAQPPNVILTNLSGLGSTNQLVFTNDLRLGKTLLVDAVFGNDITAKRENGKPFATLSNAVAAAQTWDTIKVRSGYHYGTTTLTMPIGVHLIGEGKEATIIHIERFNGNHAIGMKASNYYGSFTFITTNYDNNNYTVPFDGANLTNVVFENVRCSGYFDNWKITGNGRATIKFFNCESFSAYDSLNITANTNCTVEFYGGRYLSDFTLGGATVPFDCRVIVASFGARIRAYGTSFEARNYSVAQAFSCNPTFLDSPPGRSLQDVDVQLFGCKVYSDGTAIRNMEDLFNEAVEVTNSLPSGIYRLDGCSVIGEIRGPVWGSFTGSNFVNIGHANAFSTSTDGGFVITSYLPAHKGFIAGVSNLLTTNGGIVGFNVTNTSDPNTIKIGYNTTPLSVSATKMDSPIPVNAASTVSATNMVVTNLIRNIPRTAAFDGTNVFIDGRLGNFWNLTMTNNVKLHATNIQAGATYIVNMLQDGTGSRLLYVASLNIQTNASNPHVLSTAANAIDVLYWTADITGTNVNSILNANFAK